MRITAEIEPEETGLQADNVRDMVLEVRKRVPTLVVDGSGQDPDLDGGDLYHLKAAYEAARSYEIERCKMDDLDKINLDLYPTVIFLNVSEIKSDKTLKKVQEYVQHGGSLCYFLGDKVRPTFYNDTLFKKFNGLFPVLIGNKPYDPLDPTGLMPPEEREEKRKERLVRDEQPKLLFRDPKHAAAETLYKNRSGLRYLNFDRYFQALPRSQWDPEPTSGVQAEEIVVLPNNHPIDDYKPVAPRSWPARWLSRRKTSLSPNPRRSTVTRSRSIISVRRSREHWPRRTCSTSSSPSTPCGTIAARRTIRSGRTWRRCGRIRK